MPGRVKTRLTPPFTPTRPPRWPRPRSPTPSHAVLPRPPAAASWSSTVRPGPGCRPASRSSRRARAASTNGSPPPSPACDGPALLIGMDTPQVTPALLAPALDLDAWDEATRGSALPRTADSGRWASPTPDPRPAAGRTDVHRPGPERCSGAALTGAGLAVRDLPRAAGRGHRRRRGTGRARRRRAAGSPPTLARLTRRPRSTMTAIEHVDRASTGCPGDARRRRPAPWQADPYADALRTGRGPAVPAPQRRLAAAAGGGALVRRRRRGRPDRAATGATGRCWTSAAVPAGWSPRSPRAGHAALGDRRQSGAVDPHRAARAASALCARCSNRCPGRAVGTRRC